MPDPYSSEWWLARLGALLDNRESATRTYRAYYAGAQPLALASRKFREAFGTTYGRFADNFVALVVQAVEERLTVDGFRWNDDPGSRKAWRIWQDNYLDAQSQKAHREALITGVCPVIVGPGEEGPVIRAQKAEEVAVGYGDDPMERAAALKRFRALDGTLLATLYYPDRIEKYQQPREGALRGQWVPRATPGEDWPLVHDLGEVPVVELVNDPDLDNFGTSEIRQVLPLQDALNKLLVDMLVASEFAAFRQRWVTGMEVPVDPETGKPIELFKAAVDRVWQARDPGVKFGDFEQSDLTPYVRAIETVIQHMATTTRTPAHYLLGSSGTFPSGESLRATETGLVAKAKRRMRDMGEGWEEVMRIAFAAAGDATRSEYHAGEIVWRDPEYRTEAEHVDALVKLGTIGVPEAQLWEDAGYTPQQIERFNELKAPEPQPVEEPITVTRDSATGMVSITRQRPAAPAATPDMADLMGSGG